MTGSRTQLSKKKAKEVAGEMLRLREGGDDDLQIAEQYHCSPNTVRNRINKILRGDIFPSVVSALEKVGEQQNEDTEILDWIKTNHVELLSFGDSATLNQVTLWDEKWENILHMEESFDLIKAIRDLITKAKGE